MNINTNYDSQTSFQGMRWENVRKEGAKTVKEVISDRLPSGEFSKFIEELEQKIKNSPVTLKFGFADGFGDRLDAQIYSGGKKFKYFAEKRWANLLNLSPIKFIKKVIAEFKNMEKEVRISNN